MARGPVGQGGSSTIVQPTVAGLQKAQTISRAQVGIRRIFFTAKDLADPDRLYQVISKLQDFVSQALRPLASDPTIGGNLIQNVTFTAGQTQYLAHNLGRAWVGMTCTKAVGGYPAFKNDAALPTNVTSAQVIPVTSQNAGTFDLKVF